MKRLVTYWKVRKSFVTARAEAIGHHVQFRSSGQAAPAGTVSRLFLLAFLSLAFSLCLVVRLVFVQIYDRAHYLRKAQGQHSRAVAETPDRGRIMDRNFSILALDVNVESFGVRRFLSIPVDNAKTLSFIRTVAEMTGQDPNKVIDRVRKSTKFTYLARRVNLETAAKIKNLSEYEWLKSYIQIDVETKRRYPFGEVGGQVVGFSADGIGKAGFELSNDKRLNGETGASVVLVDGRGKAYDQVEEKHRPGIRGQDVVLTIDAASQALAEKVLHETVEKHKALGGMIIVMEPRTGEILAMASEPLFDPNHPNEYAMDAQKMRPLVDTYEPGSTFKLVAATAALDTRQFSSADMIGTNGGRISFGTHTITDHEKFGTLSLRQVIEHSSNVGTIKLAQAVGGEAFFDYVRRFGFGMKTGVELPGEAKGFLLNPSRWSNSTLPTMAIGYGISVTGLQLLSAYGAIANGGYLMEPRIVRATVSPEGAFTPLEPKAIRQVMKSETAALMRDILTGVVDNGTGKNAAISPYKAAGKTGTAWKARTDGPGYTKNYRSSFVGMFPAENPQVVALVMIDEPKADGYYGGTVAAPAFRKLVEGIMHLPDGPVHDIPLPKTEDGTPMYLAKLKEIIGAGALYAPVDSAVTDSVRVEDAHSQEAIPLEDLDLLGQNLPIGPRMPTVIGLSLREAIGRLAAEGIPFTSAGTGRVVRQTPEPGRPVLPGVTSRLECRPFESPASSTKPPDSRL
ncbi:MAG: PASTA domain-containing protein [candidate division Zixibacteria bacterium]|nr:PASTA domain-containing protein [candidate division Zixibacteria bacterium]